MPDTLPIVSQNLRRQYEDLRPLFDYLKARLKYDTVRWIRAVGAKDDIVFSTRIKSFDRIYDKLVRKLPTPLPKNISLLDQIIDGEGLLDDVVGIRFVCFDPHQILRLVSNFIATERVSIQRPEYYIWQRSDPDSPVYHFLKANGFTPKFKRGSEYEDVNFIMKFAHPIDKYFRSGADSITSLQEADRQNPASSRLATLLQSFDHLGKTHPDWITRIPRFPIECQIVTATQHVYNRVQRPLYEHVIQSTDPGAPNLQTDVLALEQDMTLLKINLAAVDHLSRAINQKYGVRYEFTSEIGPTQQFDLTGRLPPDILQIAPDLVRINDEVITSIVFSQTPNPTRTKAIRTLLESSIPAFDEAVRLRADRNHDILKLSLLDLGDLPDLTAPSIYFWAYQRVILLFLASILLHSNEGKINALVVARLNDSNSGAGEGEEGPTDGEGPRVRLGSGGIAATRLFERLIHYDSVVARVLTPPGPGHEAARIDRRIFLDPLVPWRYAMLLYKNGEYRSAKDKLEAALTIWDDLEAASHDSPVPFKLPQRELFQKRIVDYEICEEMARSQFSAGSTASMIETCQLLASKAPDWLLRLEAVRNGATEPLEQARALCLELLLRLCEVSAGGVSVRVTLKEALGDIQSRFEKTRGVFEANDDIRNRSWWLLCVAATAEEGWESAYDTFRLNIRSAPRHPRERVQFEELCGHLIKMWRTGPVEHGTSFPTGVIAALKEEIDALKVNQTVDQEMKALTQVMVEAMEDIRKNGLVTSEKKEGWRKKFKDRAADTAEKIIVDSVAAGVRAILGF